MCPAAHDPGPANPPHPQNRLPSLLATLFFHLLPSICFGIIALVLEEAARLINHAAAFCHPPPNQHHHIQPSPPSSQVSVPPSPVPSSASSAPPSRDFSQQSCPSCHLHNRNADLQLTRHSDPKPVKHSNPNPVQFSLQHVEICYDGPTHPPTHSVLEDSSDSPPEPRSLAEPKSLTEPNSSKQNLLFVDHSAQHAHPFFKSQSTPAGKWVQEAQSSRNCQPSHCDPSHDDYNLPGSVHSLPLSVQQQLHSSDAATATFVSLAPSSITPNSSASSIPIAPDRTKSISRVQSQRRQSFRSVSPTHNHPSLTKHHGPTSLPAQTPPQLPRFPTHRATNQNPSTPQHYDPHPISKHQPTSPSLSFSLLTAKPTPLPPFPTPPHSAHNSPLNPPLNTAPRQPSHRTPSSLSTPVPTSSSPPPACPSPQSDHRPFSPPMMVPQLPQPLQSHSPQLHTHSAPDESGVSPLLCPVPVVLPESPLETPRLPMEFSSSSRLQPSSSCRRRNSSSMSSPCRTPRMYSPNPMADENPKLLSPRFTQPIDVPDLRFLPPLPETSPSSSMKRLSLPSTASRSSLPERHSDPLGTPTTRPNSPCVFGTPTSRTLRSAAKATSSLTNSSGRKSPNHRSSRQKSSNPQSNPRTSRRPFFTPTPPSTPKRPLPGRLVAQRVIDYETLEARACAERDVTCKVPMPPSPVLCAIYASELGNALHENGEDTDIPKSLPLENGALEENKTTEVGFIPLEGMLDERAQDPATLFSNDEGYSDESSPFEEEDEGGPMSGDVHDLVREENDRQNVGKEETSSGASGIGIVDDAPAGVDSLQEMIPERMPRGLSTRSTEPVDVRVAPLGVGVVEVESIDKLPPMKLAELKSSESLNTESYSSLDSSSSTTSMLGGGATKSRASWQKDQDLFSEEPLVTFDESLARRPSSAEKLHVDEFEREEYRDYPGSPAPGPSSPVEDDEDFEFGDDRLVTYVTSEKTLVGEEDGYADNEDSDEEEQVRSGVSGRTRWSAPMPRVDVREGSWRIGRNRSRRPSGEDKVHRQASVDVTLLSHSRMNDRPRDELPRNRHSSRILGSRVPVMPTGGRPKAVLNVGRSMSSSGARYEDWPEYAPSGDESARVSRRHASDMSFGATDRQVAMLPPELLGRPDEEEFWDERDGMPDRFGGRGWRWKLGRSVGQRDSVEARRKLMHLPWKRRKPSVLAEEARVDEDGQASESMVQENSSRRFGAGSERDLWFQSELDVETAFTLLNRICPECGFRITVRRGMHKMKIEVPCGGDMEPLLVSVALSKAGRGSLVTLYRSKEDFSGGPLKDIESASTLLRKRLESHVEFIEDSFASLYLEGSATDMESHLGNE